MTLTNLTDYPPGGYPMRDVTINFDVQPGSDLAMQGLTVVAKALQVARANNPASGLDPTWEVCLEAVKGYTCTRLASSYPKLLEQFCGERVVSASAPAGVNGVAAPVGARKGCGSCGRR